MIRSIRFQNFKALRDATLPLSQVTLIVGPNGSGKSTVGLALNALREPDEFHHSELLSVSPVGEQIVFLSARFSFGVDSVSLSEYWPKDIRTDQLDKLPWEPAGPNETKEDLRIHRLAYDELSRFQRFEFNSNAIVQPSLIVKSSVISPQGAGLASVLDNLNDSDPERFQAFYQEFCHWLPEYDRVSFDPAEPGYKSLKLRTREGRHTIPIRHLSQGTILALAILALAYLPEPPSIVFLEEPDNAIHPRLLRRVQEAIYRLAYPRDFGESREPVQVIATTHNPFFLDLFKEHPEEVVIASKNGLDATFERLSDMAHIEEILEGVQLGDIWYTGILGGVPVES